jgi:hypothetical protein
MTDTPDEPPPWVTGPPPDYAPPPIEDLIDPEIPARIAATGRDLVLAVLDENGIRKTENGWTRETPATEGERP